jgi:hypothetical protein
MARASRGAQARGVSQLGQAGGARWCTGRAGWLSRLVGPLGRGDEYIYIYIYIYIYSESILSIYVERPLTFTIGSWVQLV